MRASYHTQLAEAYTDHLGSEAWHRQRLELLKPQQRQRRAARRREVLSYCLLAILLFCAALLYMYFEARINVFGRELNDLQIQIAETQKSALRMELEIGNLSSLSRVENYATLHLGMVYPDAKSVQYLSQQASAQFNADMAALVAEAEAPESPVPAEEEKQYPLFAAWTELIGHYFSGAALAVED